MIHKITVSLKGLRKFAWRKRLDGFFSINGQSLSDSEVRKLVEYGISRGYETNEDIPAEEAIRVLGWNNPEEPTLL